MDEHECLLYLMSNVRESEPNGWWGESESYGWWGSVSFACLSVCLFVPEDYKPVITTMSVLSLPRRFFVFSVFPFVFSFSLFRVFVGSF